MQSVAEPWLLLSIGGSSFFLGLDAFAMNAPFWITGASGGILAGELFNPSEGAKIPLALSGTFYTFTAHRGG